MNEDKLIINRVSYTLDDNRKLPPDLAAYKAAKKSNEDIMVFQGELSPWSNFHKAPFTLNGQHFPTSEHWIQFHKALSFGDSVTANQILRSEMLYDAKWLSHQIQGVDNTQWRNEGYSICYEGVKAKFHQNPHLFEMLKTTYPKLVAEATMDRTWGTGIHLQDSNALRKESHNN